MRPALKRSLFGVLALVLLLALAAAWLVSSGSGLHSTLSLADRVLPGSLTWTDAQGRLTGPIVLTDVRYADEGVKARIARLRLDWVPAALMRGSLHIKSLTVQSPHIQLMPGEDQPADEASTPLPEIRLPLAVQLDELVVEQLEVETPQAEPVQLERIALSAHTGADHTLQIQSLAVEHAQGGVQMQGHVQTVSPHELELAADWHWSAEPHRVSGTTRVEGSAEQLVIEASLSDAVDAQLNAELSQPLEDLRWRLQAEVDGLAPGLLDPEWGVAFKQLQISGSGDMQRADLNVRGGVHEEQLGALQLRADLQWNEPQLVIERLEVKALEHPMQVRLDGRARPLQEPPEAQVQLRWNDLQWPPAEARWRSPDGEVQVSGSLTKYTLQGRFRVSGEQLPATDAVFEGRGDAESVQLGSLRLQTLEGQLQTRIQARWQPNLQGSLEFSGSDLNPGSHWPQWHGRLAMNGSAEWTVTDQGAKLHAQLENLEGRLRERPVYGKGTVAYSPARIVLQDVVVRSGEASLQTSGKVAEQWDLRWSLQADDLADLLPEATGRLRAQGQVMGLREQPSVEAQWNAEGLQWQDYRLTQSQGEVRLGAADGAELSMDASLAGLQLPSGEVQSVRVQGKGTQGEHTVSLSLQSEQLQLDTELAGSYEPTPVWSGRIERLRIQAPSVGDWSMQSASPLRLSRQAASLNSMCLRQEAAGICASADWEASGDTRVTLQLKDLPLALLAAGADPGMDLTGTLAGEADVRIEGERLQEVSADLGIDAGSVRVREAPEELAAWTFENARLDINTRNEQVLAKLSLELPDNDFVRGDARLRLRNRELSALAANPLQAEVEARLHSLQRLEALAPQLEELQGKLDVALSVSGTPTVPELQGRAVVDEASARLVPLGVEWEGMRLSVTANDRSRIQFDARARSGDGDLSVEGAWSRNAEDRPWQMDARIRGSRFELVDTPEARILASPTLDLNIRPKRIRVTGEVKIPEAHFEPRDFSGAVQTSGDVVIVNSESAAPSEDMEGWKVTSEVRIVLGDRVTVEGFGFEGRIDGAVKVTDSPEAPTLASGNLIIEEGRYQAYGQDLQVERGRISYAASPLDNPGLDFRAFRKVEDVIAGVKVRGTAQAPELSVYSSPTMSQADTLSYLMLGRPVSQTSGEETDELRSAATSLGLAGGGKLASAIGNRLGVEDVSLDRSSLVLGTYLSPKLYISYGLGLFDAGNSLKLRYEINDKWTLEGEGGNESGGDLLYTIEK